MKKQFKDMLAARRAGTADALAGNEPLPAPERVFFFGREMKTREVNEANKKLHDEYMAGYHEAPGVSQD